MRRSDKGVFLREGLELGCGVGLAVGRTVGCGEGMSEGPGVGDGVVLLPEGWGTTVGDAEGFGLGLGDGRPSASRTMGSTYGGKED